MAVAVGNQPYGATGLRPFDYVAPRRLEDALEALHRYGQGARLLAGGTDLMIAMRERGLRPACLIDLKRIPGLSGIGVGPAGEVTIGALTWVREVERSPLVRERFGLLASAAGALASVQVRNKATVGGNICNASPAADLAPPLLVLEAVATAIGPGTERQIPIGEFFAGPGRTNLNGDILTKLSIGRLPPGARAVYLKHGPRAAMDIAIVSVAVLGVADAAGKSWQEARIAVGSSGPTPFRARAAERFLRGAPIGPETIERAAEIAAGEASPISDVRGSGEYRRAMVRALARRGLEEVSR